MATKKMKNLTVKIIARTLFIGALGLFLYLSSSAAAKAYLGFLTLKPPNIEQIKKDEDIEATKQQIQKHFLKYEAYLPLDDIIVLMTDSRVESPFTLQVTQSVCGKGVVFILLPLTFRLPFIGDKVVEWCVKVL